MIWRVYHPNPYVNPPLCRPLTLNPLSTTRIHLDQLAVTCQGRLFSHWKLFHSTLAPNKHRPLPSTYPAYELTEISPLAIAPQVFESVLVNFSLFSMLLLGS